MNYVSQISRPTKLLFHSCYFIIIQKREKVEHENFYNKKSILKLLKNNISNRYLKKKENYVELSNYYMS